MTNPKSAVFLARLLLETKKLIKRVSNALVDRLLILAIFVVMAKYEILTPELMKAALSVVVSS